MTDDIKELERRLELATAAGHSSENDMDPECAGLHAAWLSLGELISAAQPEIALPAYAMPQPVVSKKRHRVLSVFVAAAATLFIAVTVHWFSRTTDTVLDNGSNPLTVAVNDRQLDNSASQQEAKKSNDADLAWNDSIDQEVESARCSLYRSWDDQLASAQVQYQFDNFRKDLEDSSL